MKHILRSLLFAAAALSSVSVAQAQQQSYHFYWPGPDIDSIDFGVIDNNITLLNNQIWIHNSTDDTLWYYGGSGMLEGLFLLPYDGSMSMTIAPHDSARMFTNLNTDGAQIDYYTHRFTGLEIFDIGSVSDTSKRWQVAVYNISTVYYSPDSSERGTSIFQNQEIMQWLTRYNDQNQDYEPIDSMEYYNPFDSDVTIQTLFVPKGSHFSISSLSNSNFPVTLHKNERLTVHFAYSSTADTAGYIYQDYTDSTVYDTMYYDLVVIITDTTFPVQKANYNGSVPKSNPKSFVRNSSGSQSHTEIIISENPVMNGASILVSNARSATIRIFDLLGNSVAEHIGTGWRWDGNSRSGPSILNGLYTIKAEGISTDGMPFQASKNIILMR